MLIKTTSPHFFILYNSLGCIVTIQFMKNLFQNKNPLT
nr:MAG TPA: hypothetical protein [Caudoviricetes sp.]